MTENNDFPRYEMPTLREIELDLALANPGWQALLAGAPVPKASPTPAGAPGLRLGRRSPKVTRRPSGV